MHRASGLLRRSLIRITKNAFFFAPCKGALQLQLKVSRISDSVTINVKTCRSNGYALNLDLEISCSMIIADCTLSHCQKFDDLNLHVGVFMASISRLRLSRHKNLYRLSYQ